MRQLIILGILLMLAVSVSAVLDDYPEMFFDKDEFIAKIVVGTSAPTRDITSAIQLIPSLQAFSDDRIKGAVLDEDIDNFYEENLISIGNVCDNDITTLILDADQRICEDYFEGAGYIYLFENEKTHLIIAGETPEDTEKAAIVLGNYEQYELEGNAVKITGDRHPYDIEIIELPKVQVFDDDFSDLDELDDLLKDVEEDVEVNDFEDDTEIEDEEPEELEWNPAPELIQEMEYELVELEEKKKAEEKEKQAEETNGEPEPEGFLPKVWFKFKSWLGWFFR